MSRKRALTDEQVVEIRHAWSVNNRAWATYRCRGGEQPRKLSMTDLAARYRVSSGVIQAVIDRKGAYSEKPRITLLPNLKWRTET